MDVVPAIVDRGTFSLVGVSVVDVVCSKVVLVASLDISVVGGRSVVDMVDIVDSLDIS